MTITQKVNGFFKEVYVELKKTSWLKRGEIIRYTMMVIAVTIVVAAFLGGLDYLFSSALKLFILK